MPTSISCATRMASSGSAFISVAADSGTRVQRGILKRPAAKAASTSHRSDGARGTFCLRGPRVGGGAGAPNRRRRRDRHGARARSWYGSGRPIVLHLAIAACRRKPCVCFGKLKESFHYQKVWPECSARNGRLGQAPSGYPPLQRGCRSRARASLRNRHHGASALTDLRRPQ